MIAFMFSSLAPSRERAPPSRVFFPWRCAFGFGGFFVLVFLVWFWFLFFGFGFLFWFLVLLFAYPVLFFYLLILSVPSAPRFPSQETS
jgi:hypothetical protein